MRKLKDKPTICDYNLDSDRTPVHLRYYEDKPYDELLQKKRIGDSEKSKDLKECTFTPRINQRSGRSGVRNVEDDLLAWGHGKQLKQTTARLNSMLDGQYSFSPNINPKSRKLVGRRNGPVHNRLMEAGTSRDEKIQSKLQQENENMFRPEIGDKSRQLAKRKHDIQLVKLNNGKTQNLDFYYAVPGSPSKNSKKRTYYRDVNSNEVESPNQNRHIVGCEGHSKPENHLPGKKVNPNPDYVSPYTKEVMKTDIPLKTVLRKAAKLRESPRKRKKPYQGSPKKYSSKSKSKSRKSPQSKSPKSPKSKSPKSPKSKSPKSIRSPKKHNSEEDSHNAVYNSIQSPQKSVSPRRLTLEATSTSYTGLPIRKLDNHLKARRHRLDPKYLASKQESQNRSKSRQKVKNVMYSHKLSPYGNDKFKKNIGISTSKQIALDSYKTYQNRPEWEGKYFEKAYFNNTLVVTRDLKSWKEDY